MIPLNSVTSALTTTASALLLPLYIYPTSPSSWSNIFTSLATSTSTPVLAVIDINSGPGPGPYPVADYIPNIAKLNSYPNVRTLCYIHTVEATRPLLEVLHEIDICAGWASYAKADIHMGGIFFDEAPSSATPAALTYMTTASTYARTALAAFSPVITFNPGLPAGSGLVDSAFFDIADYINVFEDDWSKFSPAVLAAVPIAQRPQSGFIIHGFTGSLETQAGVVGELRMAGIGGVFITTEPGYTSWSSLWAPFYTAMRKMGS